MLNASFVQKEQKKMRHNKKFNHLGRTASHRNAMLANMATSLILSSTKESLRPSQRQRLLRSMLSH